MAQSDPAALLAVARLVRPHGLRGEISAIALAPPLLEPDGLIVDRRLHLRDDAGHVTTARGESVRPHKDRWLIKLEGIDSIEQADTLRGVDLCLPRRELPDLPDGWYYEADLEGCRVIDRRLGELGTVEALIVDCAQPQILVRLVGGSAAPIPWVRAFIREVDLEGRLIGVQLPPGIPGIPDPEAEG